MATVADRVRAENNRFRDVLPDLLKKYRGRWVVFRDGEVQSDFATEDEAYADAVQRFGHDGGFVVAPVQEVTPTPLTAAIAFSCER